MGCLSQLQNVARTLSVMQRLMPPPPAVDWDVPEDARIGYTAFELHMLEGLELHIQDHMDAAYARKGFRPPEVLVRFALLRVKAASPPHDKVDVELRKVLPLQ